MFTRPGTGGLNTRPGTRLDHLQSIRWLDTSLAMLIQYFTLAFDRIPPGRMLATTTVGGFPLNYLTLAEKPGETTPKGADIGASGQS